MNRKIKNIGLISAALFLALQTSVLADGYSPYGGHIPEDTGFADGMLFTVVAIATYAVGLGFIGLSRLLKGIGAK